MERIICAKILAEYISACEDLGAFGDAIRSRKKDSIFQRYLKSSTGQAAEFFDQHVLAYDVPNDPNITLQTILGLPELTTLTDRLSQGEYAACQQSYRNQAINLFVVAKTYREIGKDIKTMSNSGVLSSHLDDEMHIIIDLIQAGSMSSQKGGIFARTLNKIKHRFREDLETMRFPMRAPGRRSSRRIKPGGGITIPSIITPTASARTDDIARRRCCVECWAAPFPKTCFRGRCMRPISPVRSTNTATSNLSTGNSLGKMGWPEKRCPCESMRIRSKLSTRRPPSRCIRFAFRLISSRSPR